MIDSTDFECGVPSEKASLLKMLRGAKVTGMKRYSLDPLKEAMEDWGIPASRVFRWTEGPLVIDLDSGISLGFNGVSEYASIVVWVEETAEGIRSNEPLSDDDDEIFLIDVLDEFYSEELISKTINREITNIQILRRRPSNAKLAALPCEAGLSVEFEDNTKFILSHGLHDSSSDFAIIKEDEILESTAKEIDWSQS